MKKLLLIILSLTSISLAAQNKEQKQNTQLTSEGKNQCDVCYYYKIAIRNSSIDSLNLLLQDEDLSIENTLIIIEARIQAKYKLNKANIKRKNHEGMDVYKDILEDYNQLIALRSTQEMDTSNPKIKRYLMFGNTMSYDEVAEDKALFKKYYVEKNRKGLAASLISRYNGNFWLGGELTLFGFHAKGYTVKDATGKIIENNKENNIASFLTLGFQTNLDNRKQNITTFDLVSIKAPLALSPTQFGVFSNDGKTNPFYFPEIGFGGYGFTCTYGYMVFFRKGIDFPKRHMVSLKYTYTFNL